jgi:hypothetical protein
MLKRTARDLFLFVCLLFFGYGALSAELEMFLALLAVDVLLDGLS